ncbi:MAG: hypothetical protein ACLUQC_04220 [Lactococcus raffinolactis]|uniref:hypothetical protein n=1 Tax=Pseudolactococcus raffinolactis TaxID=1366 RepID=UPI003992377E
MKQFDIGVYERNKGSMGSWRYYRFLQTQPLYFIQDFLDKRVNEFPPKFKTDFDYYWVSYLAKHSALFIEFLDEYDLNGAFKFHLEQQLAGERLNEL